MAKISDQKLQEKIGFKPFDAQNEILRSKDKEVVLACGVRWGKTYVAAYKALRELYKDGKRIWIVAPTYGLAEKVFNYVADWVQVASPSLAPAISYRNPARIKTPWGSWIECKSAETPEGLLGEELDLVVVDEAARLKRDIWNRYLKARLVSRAGQAVLISTPFGQNWFYEEFIKAKERKSAYQFRSVDSPYFPKDYWDKYRQELPEQIFSQEYEASFLPDAASVFRGVPDIVGDCLEDAKPGHSYVLGVDLGRFEDFTVLTVMDRLTKRVVYWDRFKKLDFEFQKKRIVGVAQRYNHARVVIDSTTLGGSTKEDLERAGLVVDGIVFWNNWESKKKGSKKDLIEKLSLFIENKYIAIPNIPELVDELTSFGYQLTDSGNVQYGAPSGLHDDAVISLALAVWGLPTGPSKVLTPIQEELARARREQPVQRAVRL